MYIYHPLVSVFKDHSVPKNLWVNPVNLWGLNMTTCG